MSDRTVAIIISILFHVLAALVFMFLHLEPGMAEESIALIEFGFQTPANNPKIISPLYNYGNVVTPYEGSTSQSLPERVNLPKSSVAGDDALYLPPNERSAYNNIDLDDLAGTRDNYVADLRKFASSDKKTLTEEPFLPGSDEYYNSLQGRIDNSQSGGEPYILEGDILNRTILTKTIPEYPAGVQKNIEVKLRFEVMSDGSVTNVIVVKKADPELEEISMDAIREWRFNSLNQDIVQLGFITFIFQMK
ncbi:MAG: energy transducer TonB [Candidatus Cloacimonetes bacterium]|nr:energy transducer TonB [Candidatus Cloacimonadota bacterium]